MSRVIDAFTQFFDNDGAPLVDGWLRFLVSGTNNTDKNTYADINETVANSNPVQLDASGRCPNIFGTGAYRVISYTNDPVLDTPDVQIQQFDPVEGTTSTAGFASWDAQTTYNIPDVVTADDLELYRSITNDNSGNDPTLSPEDWEQVEFEQVYNENRTYSQFERCIDSQGLSYISKVSNNTGNTPSTSPDKWAGGQPSETTNSVVDGGMLVGTGGVATLSSTFQYGQCPLIEGKVVGTPSAGTLEQSETSLLGNTGFACLLNGVTVGSSGDIVYRHRIESKNVKRFIDQNAIVHAQVYHDVGASINYIITVNKADSKDDFASVTNIDTSGNLAVVSATETQISFAISDMGACGNGVEIQISAITGAITTKDFYMTELTLQRGADIALFEYQSIQEAESEVSRYFERVDRRGDTTEILGLASGVVQGTTVAEFVMIYAPKRVKPTLTTATLSLFEIKDGVSNSNLTALTFVDPAIDRVNFLGSVVSPTLVLGNGAVLQGKTSNDPYFEFDSRL
jgi:hypothetical protein